MSNAVGWDRTCCIASEQRLGQLEDPRSRTARREGRDPAAESAVHLAL